MDYTEMSLIELKHHAKKRGNIKQYYVMRRHQLIEILSMKELPTQMKLEKKTIVQLRAEAKERNIKQLWKKNRKQLMDLLYGPETTTNKKDENQCNADEHDDPKQHDSQ